MVCRTWSAQGSGDEIWGSAAQRKFVAGGGTLKTGGSNQSLTEAGFGALISAAGWGPA